MMTSAEAARRLGVKPQTLYAYVSRGILARHASPGGRRSLFERAEVERLAKRNRRGGRAGALEVIVDTELTLIDPAGALYYRGHDATRLARERSYEEVAELLWGGDQAGEWRAPPLPALPDVPAPADRMRLIVALAAATDPLRTDLRPPAVRHAARGLIAAMVECLPPRVGDDAPSAAVAAAGEGGPAGSRAVAAGAGAGGPAGSGAVAAGAGKGGPAGSGAVAAGAGEGAPIAARLWARVASAPPTAGRLRALNGALVLLADHELAVSALAARVAASGWADPYLAVLAGLSAMGGALHGAAAGATEAMLESIGDVGDVPRAVGERLRAGGSLPGFGHAVYRGRDPRADALLALLAEAEPRPQRHAIAHEVLRLAGRHDGPAPNVDFALGALSDCLGLIPGSAEAIFAVARAAGLIAHALEEYPHRLRFRSRAAYVGPGPG